MDIRQEITNRIIARIEEGGAVYTCPWDKKHVGMPRNALSKRHYNGINVVVLWCEQYASADWLTYRQAQQAGAHVKRGEKAVPVIFIDKAPTRDSADKPDEEKTYYNFMKRFFVFNREQIEGLPPVTEEAPAEREFSPLASADELIRKTGADIRNGTRMAFYDPKGDFIRLPEKADFKTDANFYRTAFHELSHWTGHVSRLDRSMFRQDDESIAMEELIAELSASFLCAHVGIFDAQLEQHAAYVDAWLKILKADKSAIFTAAAAATKAADWILGKQENKATA
jgi:antirestriction protein ArdC